MENAERLQWTTLTLGVLAIAVAALQWVSMAPVTLTLGVLAAAAGAVAVHLSEKRKAPTRVPARVGLFLGSVAAAAGYLTLTVS